MRPRTKWIQAFALTAACSSGCAVNYEVDGHWSVLAEYVFMRRSEVNNRSIVKDLNTSKCVGGCRTRTVMDTNDVVNDFDFESGARVGVAYLPDTKSIYEASFMYIWPWEATETVHGDDSLYYPFGSFTFTDDFVDAEEAKANYKSQFYTFELNYWRNSARRGKDYFVVSGIFGIRFVEIKEKFFLAYYNTEDALGGVNKSNYNAKTRNDMIGVQAGMNLQVNPFWNFNLDFSAKGGIGLDRAYEKVFLGDLDNTVVIRDFSKERWVGSAFGEGSAKIGYTVVPNLNIHGGYQIFCVSGIALAPDQLSYSHVASSQRFWTGGLAIIHGMFFGINLNF